VNIANLCQDIVCIIYNYWFYSEVDLCISLAELYHDLGFSHKAIERYKRALRISNKKESDFVIYYNLCKIYFDTGFPDEAFKYCARMIKINPTDPLAYATMGYYYLLKGKYEESLSTFRQAIAINPNAPEPYFYIGCILIAIEMNYNEGIRMLNKALERGTLFRKDVRRYLQYAHNKLGGIQEQNFGDRHMKLKLSVGSHEAEMLLLWEEAEGAAGMEEDNRFLIG